MEQVHFGKRLKAVRESKFGTQADLAKWMYDHGYLKSPNQSTIAKWEGMKSFTGKRVKEALMGLASIGINPAYFFSITETNMEGPVRTQFDEADWIELNIEVSKLRKLIIELQRENKELSDRIKRLQK